MSDQTLAREIFEALFRVVRAQRPRMQPQDLPGNAGVVLTKHGKNGLPLLEQPFIVLPGLA